MSSFHSEHVGQCYRSTRHGAVTTSNMFTVLSLSEPARKDMRKAAGKKLCQEYYKPGVTGGSNLRALSQQ